MEPLEVIQLAREDGWSYTSIDKRLMIGITQAMGKKYGEQIIPLDNDCSGLLIYLIQNRDTIQKLYVLDCKDENEYFVDDDYDGYDVSEGIKSAEEVKKDLIYELCKEE